jgi:hypothetical protein
MLREGRFSTMVGSMSLRSLRLRWAVAAIALTSMLATSRADDPRTTKSPAPDASGRDAEARTASLESLLPELSPAATGEGPRPQGGESPKLTAPRAVVRLVGTAAPGLRVVLDGSGSTGQSLWYRWVQTQGPPAPLDTDGGPTAALTVPAEASSLSYLLLVGNGTGADVTTLTVPVEFKGGSAQAGGLRADAGDDQIGQVGRQITLNGLRSIPRGRLGYRWIQMSGPTVSLKIEDGHVFTFVPPANGLYQFGLVVAAGSEISEPDLVNVAVGVALPPPMAEPIAAVAAAPVSLKDLARAALAQVEGGRSAGEDLGVAFEEVAARMDLYSSYAELMVELTRRLEEIVPAEAQRRSAWLGSVFAPLTARVIDQMRSEGLDLSRPEGQAAEMTKPQRKVLAQQFKLISAGFRSAGDAR